MKSLGEDELELISKKLTFSPDYTRFRSVCKLWRSAAPRRPQNPWLIVRDQIESTVSTCVFKFYQFSFDTNKFLQIPELSLPSVSSSFIDNQKLYWIGTSHGWMALLNRSTDSVFLFNPLTSSSIDLPVLQNCSSVAFEIDFNFHLTSDPSESLSDCFALVYFSTSQKLMYCKVGSTVWIEIPHAEFRSYSGHINICSYSGKTFISSHSHLYICDFGLSGSNPYLQKAVSFHQDDVEQSYLVESDGDLLFVLKCSCVYNEEDEDESYYYDYDYFQVFKVEFECEAAKLVELKSLSDRALFLSPQTAFSLTASKYPGWLCTGSVPVNLPSSLVSAVLVKLAAARTMKNKVLTCFFQKLLSVHSSQNLFRHMMIYELSE